MSSSPVGQAWNITSDAIEGVGRGPGREASRALRLTSDVAVAVGPPAVGDFVPRSGQFPSLLGRTAATTFGAGGELEGWRSLYYTTENNRITIAKTDDDRAKAVAAASAVTAASLPHLEGISWCDDDRECACVALRLRFRQRWRRGGRNAAGGKMILPTARARLR